MPRWYCCRTLYNAEITADIELRLAGFRVFNPSIFKAATRPRRDSNGVVRPGKPDRIAPMFPRYLFVSFDREADPWPVIRRLPGIECLFSAGADMPLPVPDAAIDAIRAVLAPNECAYPVNHRVAPLAVGSKARVLAGPLAALSGVVAMSDGARVKLLLEVMGRSVPVLVPQAGVEPIQ